MCACVCVCVCVCVLFCSRDDQNIISFGRHQNNTLAASKCAKHVCTERYSSRTERDKKVEAY